VPGFIQIIEFSSSRIDEIDALVEEMIAESDGQMKVRRAIETEDHDRPGRYMTIVEFGSYEEAMENSNDPRVAEFSERFATLADAPPRFHNLDVRVTRDPWS
jgi:hypothetical protein